MTVDRNVSVILSTMINCHNECSSFAGVALYQLKTAEYYHNNNNFKLTMVNLEPFKDLSHLEAYKSVLRCKHTTQIALSLLIRSNGAFI